MKILIACELPPTATEELTALGAAVEFAPALSAAELANRIGDVSILVTGQTPVSPETIARGTMLQMIICAGSSAANVAIDDASAQGVFVTHCPDTDATACAELTFGLLLALDRHLIGNANTLREGRWERPRFLNAHGLAGRTLGVLGSCPFRQAIAKRAAAFEMSVLTWMDEPMPDAASACGMELCNWPRELARRSDMLAIHTPTGQGYEQIVDADFIESIRDGASFVHVGDVKLLDEAALAAAVEQRGVRLALDVYAGEPTCDSGRVRSRLLTLPGVIGTHHVSGATEQARLATAEEIVRIISAFLVAGEVRNALNLCEHSPATWQLVLRLRDQVGVLASVLETIRADGVNAEEITSKVFRGAKAAWCTIALDERPSAEAITAIQSLDDVLHLELRAMM